MSPATRNALETAVYTPDMIPEYACGITCAVITFDFLTPNAYTASRIDTSTDLTAFWVDWNVIGIVSRMIVNDCVRYDTRPLLNTK